MLLYRWVCPLFSAAAYYSPMAHPGARALPLLVAAALGVSRASLPDLNFVRDCGGVGDGATLNDAA